ncbi:NAD(P)-dependent dehydrogenase, short-chain alcohol dehydrogenase family [Sphingopyxis flava]|uniref:NAD(P)-dependent dehydrogenase, short-chain alcohol dehydrogenase family n=2 Tax=Sphingopyxis flava TaxID=1507287 RepID=A0A1T5E762_9SPHN|nr:glucose 1-dehydrogenase [Sphingopyxis flava]SKB79705.1 NAD(P)-dependent dehydrogenase, short-chain alcohol dehydrogenase family [Sphingopyxis flava]
MNDPHFTGKTALVTGSGAGIGRATAKAFAAKGVRVVVSDISLADAEDTVASIRDGGGEAAAMQCDATDGAAVERLVQATLDRFGSLDFAHNNVGVGTGKSIEDLTEADYRLISDTSLKSVMLGMKYQLPVMRAQGGGAIVNTASMAGISTVQTADIVYAGAKAGVIQMTAHAARTYAPYDIRVNCVAPGLVRTKILSEMFTHEQQMAMADFHLIKRLIEPEEIAAAAIFLCSADAAMITGHCLPVDGGQSAIR